MLFIGRRRKARRDFRKKVIEDIDIEFIREV